MNERIADWQRERLAPAAIPVSERVPPARKEVLGWVSDASVAIHHFPLVVWLDGNGQWWGGLPASYLDLRRLKWTVTHWMPIGDHGDGAIKDV